MGRRGEWGGRAKNENQLDDELCDESEKSWREKSEKRERTERRRTRTNVRTYIREKKKKTREGKREGKSVYRDEYDITDMHVGTLGSVISVT